MRAFYAAETAAHSAHFFMMRGRVAANEERAERAKRLLAGLSSVGISTEEPDEAGPVPRGRVHSPDFLDFLERAWGEWQHLENAGPEVVANVQPRRPEARYPAGIVGRAGWHMGDLACPLGEHTFRAACRSADAAVAAARAVKGGAPVAYALSRPPGHHSSREVAAGHCILNNAAIAAADLTASGVRTAVLDIDVHHGNGTQAIFYDSAEVLTVSVHADTNHFYPWFTGDVDERGAGPGEGFNHNIVLPMGEGDEAWLAAVSDGLSRVKRFGVDALVLSLGLDVHGSDPLAGLCVTTEGIGKAGALVREAGLPTAIIQEGGYLSDALGDNLAAFMNGVLARS